MKEPGERREKKTCTNKGVKSSQKAEKEEETEHSKILKGGWDVFFCF